MSKTYRNITLSDSQRVYLPVAIALLVLNILVIVHSLDPVHSGEISRENFLTGFLFIMISSFIVPRVLPLMDDYPILHWVHILLIAAFIGIITSNQPGHMLNLSIVLIATTTIGIAIIAGRIPAYFLIMLVAVTRFYIYRGIIIEDSFESWMRALALPMAGIVCVETILIMRTSIAKEVLRLKTINRVAQSFSSSLEINQVITLISHAVQDTLQADTYYVALFHEDKLHLDLLYDDGEFFPPMDIPLEGTLAGYLIKSQEPLLLYDLSKQQKQMGFNFAIVGKPRVSRSWMGVPLIANQKVLGLVAVAAYKPGHFNQKDLEMIQSIALQASLAIDNARNHTAVLEQSRQDSLTGALNHGTFIAMLQKEIEKSKASNHSVAVIMLDVDSFKHYNDTWGHLVGDQVLTTLTSVIQEHVKQTDLVGRWGGEEFAIALPKASLTQAVSVAERIRSSMQEIELSAKGNGKLPCPTVSQGIAVFPEDAENAFGLIDTADKRLYCAKQKGRNQIYSEKAT